jgi:hypothetical protein
VTTERPTFLGKSRSEHILELDPTGYFFYGDELTKIHPANRLMTGGSLIAFTRKSGYSLRPITLNTHDIPIVAHKRMQDAANVQRADGLAARTSGFGGTELDGSWAATVIRGRCVLLSGDESQIAGFARNAIGEAGPAADWFLIRRRG